MTAQEAKRAFVTVLLALAAVYGLVLNINRESVDTELVSAFKRVARKAHPDEGGTVEDSARLHASRDAWKDALLGRRKPGRERERERERERQRELLLLMCVAWSHLVSWCVGPAVGGRLAFKARRFSRGKVF